MRWLAVLATLFLMGADARAHTLPFRTAHLPARPRGAAVSANARRARREHQGHGEDDGLRHQHPDDDDHLGRRRAAGRLHGCARHALVLAARQPSDLSGPRPSRATGFVVSVTYAEAVEVVPGVFEYHDKEGGEIVTDVSLGKTVLT